MQFGKKVLTEKKTYLGTSTDISNGCNIVHDNLRCFGLPSTGLACREGKIVKWKQPSNLSNTVKQNFKCSKKIVMPI